MKKIVLLTMALMMVSSVSFACSSGGEDAAGEARADKVWSPYFGGVPTTCTRNPPVS